MENEWRIASYNEYNDVEILHCQKKNEELRISSTGDGTYCVSDWQRAKEFCTRKEIKECPNCKEKIPKYILLQFFLLS